MKIPKIYIYFALLILSANALMSQELRVDYVFSSDKKPDVLKQAYNQFEFKDSLSFIDYLKEQQQVLYLNAYLSNSVDSIISTNNGLLAYVFIGDAYKNIKIDYELKYQGILKKINSKYLLDEDLEIQDLEEENKKIISYLDNHGYPKAKVFLDSLSFSPAGIAGFLTIERGQLFVFGKVSSTGNIKISKSFLQGYTGVKDGDHYDLDQLKNVKKLINDLSFATQNDELLLKEEDDKIDVLIPVNKISGNRFDGILGILPNDKTTGKTVLTGEVNVALQNVFRSGEQFKFEWKKLESSSQNLNIEFSIPYIFNTNFGLSSNLSLIKQDTSFLNTNISLGALYFLGASNYVGLKYLNKSSAALIDKALLGSEFKDFDVHSYGSSLKFSKLDYNFNPRRGFEVELEAFLGQKTTYDEGAETSSQSELTSDINWYIPLLRKSTVLFSVKAANLNSKELYTNELFRIGGLSTIRGFMESSIYASSYGIVSLEYRFVFERNSALFAFVDGAWIEKRQETYFYDYPLGVGLGLFFKTKAGIFTISYAMGQQKNEQMAIKNAKIHFGFINRF